MILRALKVAALTGDPTLSNDRSGRRRSLVEDLADEREWNKFVEARNKPWVNTNRIAQEGHGAPPGQRK